MLGFNFVLKIKYDRDFILKMMPEKKFVLKIKYDRDFILKMMPKKKGEHLRGRYRDKEPKTLIDRRDLDR